MVYSQVVSITILFHLLITFLLCLCIFNIIKYNVIKLLDLNCIVVKDVLSENAEAAVRQCLRQLQLLKNVWIGVFPPNVFVRYNFLMFIFFSFYNIFIEIGVGEI